MTISYDTATARFIFVRFGRLTKVRGIAYWATREALEQALIRMGFQVEGTQVF